MPSASPSGPAAQRRSARTTQSQAPPTRVQKASQEPPENRLRQLLTDLREQVQRGDEIRCEPLARYPTGFPDVDALLGGGFPHERLSEIAGPISSGRTSLALALLAQATQAESLVAWIDLADAFDPASAEASRVELERVLWARATTGREAFLCTQRLLETDGIPLVLLDLPLESPAPFLSTATWLRLARSAAQTRTALIVLSHQRCTGSHAEIAIEMQPARARFIGTPSLLEELESRAVLIRHRTQPLLQTVPVRLGARTAA